VSQRRAAVRNLAYASAIAQAAMPEGALAQVFEDSCAGPRCQLDWTGYPMLVRGAVRGRSVKGAPDGAGGTIDIANADAGYAVVFAGYLGEVGAAEARADHSLGWSAEQGRCGTVRVGADRGPVWAAATRGAQLSSRLPFLSAALAERSTRSRRSGISWLRRSSPSSRSASSSSASRFFGLGQTIGLDLLSLGKQRSRVTAEFRR